MPLPLKIQQQKDLMTDALRKLRDIETIERLLGIIDPPICSVMVENTQKEYVEIMSMLFEHKPV